MQIQVAATPLLSPPPTPNPDSTPAGSPDIVLRQFHIPALDMSSSPPGPTSRDLLNPLLSGLLSLCSAFLLGAFVVHWLVDYRTLWSPEVLDASFRSSLGELRRWRFVTRARADRGFVLQFGTPRSRMQDHGTWGHSGACTEWPSWPQPSSL